MKKKENLTKNDKKQIEILSDMGKDDLTISNELKIKVGVVRQYLKDKSLQSKGLGDTIEKITEKTGIKKLVNYITNGDCGCEERKDKLNKLFRYRRVHWLNQDEYDWITEFSKRKDKDRLDPSDQKFIFTTANRIFEMGYHPTQQWCSCNPKKYVDALGKIKRVYDEMTDILEEKIKK